MLQKLLTYQFVVKMLRFQSFYFTFCQQSFVILQLLQNDQYLSLVQCKLIMASEKGSQQDQPQFQQKLKKSQERSKEYFQEIKKQIQIENEKINRLNTLNRQKAQRVYRKFKSKKYQTQQIEDLQIPVDGELERGSKIFMMYCSSCHTLQQSSRAKSIGPALGLIFNRKIGTDINYFGYSQAMIKTQQFWTARNLYKFMLNPQQFISGTLCQINSGKGLRSEQDRADLLQFLKQYSKQLFMNIQIKEVKQKGYSQLQTQMYAAQKGAQVTDERVLTKDDVQYTQ